MSAAGAALIVEDNGLIRELLAELLVEDGVVVRTAEHGRAALAVLAEWRPHVIILDLDMPEMDGRAFRVIQLASPALADIPVLLLSAAPDLQAQAAQLEITEMLTKPCDLSVLVATVQRIIAGVASSAVVRESQGTC